MFNLQLLPRHNLPKKSIGGKRYYITPDGSALKSVTTVLSDYYKPETHLKIWREKIGKKAAATITNKARNRGTSLHLLCEKYLKNETDFFKKIMPDNLSDFQEIKKKLDLNVTCVMGVEHPLYSYYLKSAGTADLICTWGNQPSIVDFKTSRKEKKEEWIENYFIQSSAYALMANELYGLDISQIIVVLLVEHCAPQIFIKNTAQYKDKLNEIFLSDRLILPS